GDGDPREQPWVGDEAPQVGPEAARRAGRRGGRGDRVEGQGDAGERATDPRPRREPATDRGIDEVHAAPRGPLEHDEVVEAPVEDRRRREVLEILEVEAEAAPAQAERGGGLD